jgi:hypothetical protein
MTSFPFLSHVGVQDYLKEQHIGWNGLHPERVFLSTLLCHDPHHSSEIPQHGHPHHHWVLADGPNTSLLLHSRHQLMAAERLPDYDTVMNRASCR